MSAVNSSICTTDAAASALEKQNEREGEWEELDTDKGSNTLQADGLEEKSKQ